jgi:SAM-dependent methyltransferase
MLDGQWQDTNSELFRSLIQFSPDDLFESPAIRVLRNHIDFSSVKNMLSVGSGNGRYDLSLMKRYSMTVDFIEPSPKMGLTENLSRNRGPGLAGLVHDGTFETFATDIKYDFIHSIHSFYFIKAPAKSVRKALNLLKPNGQLAIILRLDDSLGTLMMKEFDRECFAGDLTAESLVNMIEAPCDFSIFLAPRPCSELFEGTGLSDAGKALVSFYANREWSALSKAETRRAFDLAEKYSDGQTVNEKFGLLLIRNSEN